MNTPIKKNENAFRTINLTKSGNEIQKKFLLGKLDF